MIQQKYGNDLRCLSYLSRKGVKEVDQLEARVLDCLDGLSDDHVQRPLGFLQQSVEPHLYIPFCCDRTFQLHGLSLP